MTVSHSSIRYLWQAGLLLGLVILPGIPICAAQDPIPGYPFDVQSYDAREVALLPSYCIYTQAFSEKIPAGKKPGEFERLSAQMGKIFNAMHHYCWGLMHTNRAVILARSQYYRQYYLKMAIGDFDYVIERAPRDFVMLPEIVTKKGENLIRLGKVMQGLEAYAYAIELKPDYWPPYAYMSDYYKGSGDLQKAREILEQGLSLSPDTTALKRRLAELDTVKSKPKVAPEPAKKPAASERPTQEKAPRPAQKMETPQSPAGR